MDRKKKLGAAAVSLTAAATVLGASPARAEDVIVIGPGGPGECAGPCVLDPAMHKIAAIDSVLFKLTSKFDESFSKLDTALSKIRVVMQKWTSNDITD